MSHCRRYQEMIEDALAGELSGAELTEVDEHCAGCSECAELWALHRSLQELGDAVPLPEKHDFREMREAVLAATAQPRIEPGFFADLNRFWRAHPLPAGLATAAVLVCALFVGREFAREGTLEEELLQQSARWSATRQAGLDELWDTPFSFANVTVRAREQGQLALSFDASRHVDLQVPQDSPLAREVLLHAILDPSSMGSQLRAMEVAAPLGDSRLKEALIVTMLNDSDPTVRLAALGVMSQYPHDQQSQEALLQVLGQDQNVQMRLSALEELARRNVGQETIREAVGENGPEGTMAILRQASIRL